MAIKLETGLIRFLFGTRTEKFINRYLSRFFYWENKILQKLNKNRLINNNETKGEDWASDEKNNEKNITIIIPVFNAYQELKECLESVIRNTQAPPYRLLMIDDASTDVRIRPLLKEYGNRYSHISVLYNERNLGYTATINKACVHADSDDVVLLNSDTQVTKNWLTKMSECAKSNPRVATVTPLSNAAGAFSVPQRDIDNNLKYLVSIDEMGGLVERLSLKRRPVVPTGNGFCMYVARRALTVVGLFDAYNFPRGYGEENDFCMRSSQKGFIHLIDDSTFVYHKRTSSYQETKKKIISSSMRRLDRLHPEYKLLVLKWLIADPLDEFRDLLLKQLEYCRNHENSF